MANKLSIQIHLAIDTHIVRTKWENKGAVEREETQNLREWLEL